MTLSSNARGIIEGPNFAFVATLMPDGAPHCAPMWVDVDDEGFVLLNTFIGRLKERNLRRDPRIAVSVARLENQYDKVDIRGRVIEFRTGDEADRHIDKLSQKYLGRSYPFAKPGEVRVMFRVEPLHVVENAGSAPDTWVKRFGGEAQAQTTDPAFHDSAA